MQKLTPIIIAGLFSTTSFAVMAEELDFDRHDANGDGYLSQAEFQNVQGVDAQFETADQDGDGMVSKDEVKAVAGQSDSSAQSDWQTSSDWETSSDMQSQDASTQSISTQGSENKDVNFDQHDMDGDGYLSETEFQDVQATDAQFETVDQDGDGRVSREEVKSADSQSSGGMATSSQVGMQGSSGNSSQGAALTGQKSFTEYDTDGNGEISATEAQSDEELAAHFAVLDADGSNSLDKQELEGNVHEQVSSGGMQSQGNTDSRVSYEQADSSVGTTSESAASYEQSGSQDAQSDATYEQASQDSQQPGSQQGAQGPKMSDAAFQEIDANGDDRISEDEAQQSGNDYVVSSFDGLDENGDGEISKDEVR